MMDLSPNTPALCADVIRIAHINIEHTLPYALGQWTLLGSRPTIFTT